MAVITDEMMQERRTPDMDEVRRIMDGDPGVQAGVFTYELHPCRSFPGSALPPT